MRVIEAALKCRPSRGLRDAAEDVLAIDSDVGGERVLWCRGRCGSWRGSRRLGENASGEERTARDSQRGLAKHSGGLHGGIPFRVGSWEKCGCCELVVSISCAHATKRHDFNML